MLDELAIVCVHLQRHALELCVKTLAAWVWDIEDRRSVSSGGAAGTPPDLFGHDLVKLKETMQRIFERANRPVPSMLVSLCDDFAAFEDGDETRWRYGTGKERKKGAERYRDTYEDTSFPRAEVIPVRDLQQRLEELDRDVMATTTEGDPTVNIKTLADELYRDSWELDQEEGSVFEEEGSRKWEISCADCGGTYAMTIYEGFDPTAPDRRMRCFLCGSRKLAFKAPP